jgi:integrase
MANHDNACTGVLPPAPLGPARLRVVYATGQVLEGMDGAARLDEAWRGTLDDYRAWMVAAGVAASTLRIYLCYVVRLASRVHGLGPWEVGVDELAAFLSVAAWRPATRKSARAAVRSFYGWATITGRMSADPSRLLRPVRVPAGLPRPCPDDVLNRALLRAGARDQLMLMLPAYAGLRRAETAGVHSRDVAGSVLRVYGKGGKVRDVPLHPVLIDAIDGRPHGWLFPGQVDGGGHLSPDRVGHVIRDLLGSGWTAHTLRHRFLTRCYAAERDVRAVQVLAGHAKLDTTMIYTKVPDGALLRAVMAAGPAA